jgi:hypothetical protein
MTILLGCLVMLSLSKHLALPPIPPRRGSPELGKFLFGFFVEGLDLQDGF